MSNNRLMFEGLEELRAALRDLPAELVGEASSIVMGAAEEASTAIVAAYPNRTSNLRDHVTISTQAAGRFGTAAVVKNTSKLAYIFENGTQARHTSLGANRGSMPPGHVFIPRVIKARRRMYEHLKALLQRAGLVVSGDAG